MTTRRRFLQGLATIPILLTAPALAVPRKSYVTSDEVVNYFSTDELEPLIDAPLNYIVIEDLPLKDFGNRVPQLRAEVETPVFHAVIVRGSMSDMGAMQSRIKVLERPVPFVINVDHAEKDTPTFSYSYEYSCDVKYFIAEKDIVNVRRIWLDEHEVSRTEASEYSMKVC